MTLVHAKCARGGSFCRCGEWRILRPAQAAHPGSDGDENRCGHRMGRNAPAPRSRGRASAAFANCRVGPASARRSAEPAAGSATEPASSSTARGRRGRTIVPNPLQRPMSKTV